MPKSKVYMAGDTKVVVIDSENTDSEEVKDQTDEKEVLLTSACDLKLIS